MKKKSPFQSPADQALFWQGTALMILLGIAALLILVSFELLIHPRKTGAETNLASVPVEVLDPDRIEHGIDVETGFFAEGDYMLVKRNCTGCHSAKMVIQNRATREGWLDMIRWMQKEQKLWDLGDNEVAILDYLEKYYGPEDKGRRQNLHIEDWYEISSTYDAKRRKELIRFLSNV